MNEKRLISSKQIVAKVIADLDLQEGEIRISDINEWIAEGLEKIGSVRSYEHKVTVLPIVDHQVSLPCDLHQLDQVAYSFKCDGRWLSMRKATSAFGVTHDIKCKCGKPNMLIPDTAMFPIVKNMYNLVKDEDALAILNKEDNLRETLSVLLNQWTDDSVNGHHFGHKGRGHLDGTMYSCDLQYTTKPGYIMTNAPKGFVKISYYAIPTDDDSMPLIPNNENVKEALTWYIILKLLYPKKLRGVIKENDYTEMKNNWHYYKRLAYGDSLMPSNADEMESIKNTWLKLYPEQNDHDLFFSTTGEEQNYYNNEW